MYQAFNTIRGAIASARDVVMICFMCRRMDQMNNDNFGGACREYIECFTSCCRPHDNNAPVALTGVAPLNTGVEGDPTLDANLV